MTISRAYGSRTACTVRTPNNRARHRAAAGTTMGRVMAGEENTGVDACMGSGPIHPRCHPRDVASMPAPEVGCVGDVGIAGCLPPTRLALAEVARARATLVVTRVRVCDGGVSPRSLALHAGMAVAGAACDAAGAVDAARSATGKGTGIMPCRRCCWAAAAATAPVADGGAAMMRATV